MRRVEIPSRDQAETTPLGQCGSRGPAPNAAKVPQSPFVGQGKTTSYRGRGIGTAQRRRMALSLSKVLSCNDSGLCRSAQNNFCHESPPDPYFQFPHRRAQILKICASIGCRVARTVLIGPVPVDPSTSETVTPLRVLTGAGAVGADLLLYSTRRVLPGALKVISKITSTETLCVVLVLATINTS